MMKNGKEQGQEANTSRLWDNRYGAAGCELLTCVTLHRDVWGGKNVSGCNPHTFLHELRSSETLEFA